MRFQKGWLDMTRFRKLYNLTLVALPILLLQGHITANAADPYFFPATNQSVDKVCAPTGKLMVALPC